MDTHEETQQRHSSGKGVKIALAVVAAGALALNMYLVAKVDRAAESAVGTQASLENKILELEATLSHKDGQNQRSLESLRAELDQAQKQAYSSARNEARRQSEGVSKLIAEKQREQQEMLLGELSGVRAGTQQNSDEIAVVNEAVSGVQQQVDQTRSALDAAEIALHSTQDQLRSGIDTLSGEIGANAELIEKLRRNGEREVTPFTVVKSNERTRVQDVQLKLRDTDPGKHRFAVEILADDRVIVQKGRYVNEPVEFYISGAQTPYEIVVTAVKRDEISGFLVKPKFMQMASR